jgi:hypothetical protein
MFGLLSLGRIQLYVAAALAVTGIYFFWKHNIEQQVLMEYNQKQLEQSISDRNKLKQDLEAINLKQEEILRKAEEEKKAYELKLEAINQYLNSKEVKSEDKPASDILRQTVKQLTEISK